jgi:hypothetical protein
MSYINYNIPFRRKQIPRNQKKKKKTVYHRVAYCFFIIARRRPTLAGGIPQLPSALKSLTSVFGMGTGVTSSLSSPDYMKVISSKLDNTLLRKARRAFLNWLSPRSISISQLHVSPRFHL